MTVSKAVQEIQNTKNLNQLECTPESWKKLEAPRPMALMMTKAHARGREKKDRAGRAIKRKPLKRKTRATPMTIVMRGCLMMIP